MEEDKFVNLIKQYINTKLKDNDSSKNKKKSIQNQNSLSSEVYTQWLDEAAKKSCSISIITHSAKFTNSYIKSDNIKTISVDIFLQENYNYSDNRNFFVCTANLNELIFDIYCNASDLGFAGFFLLRNPNNNNYLISEILLENTNFLYSFTKSTEKVAEWSNNFKKIIKEKKYASHTLSKQVYFPIADNEYHIVSPLMASSLYHKIYEKINYSRYSEESKNLREKRKKLEFSEERIIEFPNLTEMKFGGTKPQNISYLNSIRSGKILLLSSAPPVWNKNKSKKLITLNSFWKEFNVINYYKMKKLKIFLLNEKKNNYEIRQEREEYVNDIIENFILYLVSLKNTNSKYKFDESIFNSYLNIFFQEDKKHFTELEVEFFVENISHDFSKNVIEKISQKNNLLSDYEYNEIKKLVIIEIIKLLKYQ